MTETARKNNSQSFRVKWAHTYLKSLIYINKCPSKPSQPSYCFSRNSPGKGGGAQGWGWRACRMWDTQHAVTPRHGQD